MSSFMLPVREFRGKASDYWLGISVRERQLLSLAGCFLLIWVVYFGVVRPVQIQVEEAQQRVSNSQKQYDQVIRRAEKISELQALVPSDSMAGSHQSLDVLVNRTASKAGVTITGLNRQQESLQIRMKPVSFNKLVQWMTLLKTQSIKVSSLQIARTDKPGVVEIQQLRVEKETL
ncbi:hypothetical protein ACH42_15140 [Endozoicomonas sp. (ex Bugula neritina AB1)]|nr:hypothetical protein ACH42_15140 [Endozoicomonas sp. (ex Bugula neritina AB1)]